MKTIRQKLKKKSSINFRILNLLLISNSSIQAELVLYLFFIIIAKWNKINSIKTLIVKTGEFKLSLSVFFSRLS